MRRPITLAAVFLFALTFAAGQTAAHSKKQATVPADGAVLAISPETIAMTFDMPLRVTLISLRDQDGTDHALTRSDNIATRQRFCRHTARAFGGYIHGGMARSGSGRASHAGPVQL